MQDDKAVNDPDRKTISFSNGWVEKVMRRHGLSIHRRTTEAQKKPKPADRQTLCICCQSQKITPKNELGHERYRNG